MKFSLFFCTAVFSLPALVIVSACSDTQDKPQTAVQAVAQASQQAIAAPVAQSPIQPSNAPVVVDCAAPAKAVDGVCLHPQLKRVNGRDDDCLHPQLKRVNGRDDDCSQNTRCVELWKQWEQSVGATHSLFR